MQRHPATRDCAAFRLLVSAWLTLRAWRVACESRSRVSAVLIERFPRPLLQAQAHDFGGTPASPVRHQHGVASRHLRVLKADDDPDLAQAWEADRQRDAPLGLLADCDRTISVRRDQWYEICFGNMGAWQLHSPAIGVPQVKAGRSPQAVFL